LETGNCRAGARGREILMLAWMVPPVLIPAVIVIGIAALALLR